MLYYSTFFPVKMTEYGSDFQQPAAWDVMYRFKPHVELNQKAFVVFTSNLYPFGGTKRWNVSQSASVCKYFTKMLNKQDRFQVFCSIQKFGTNEALFIPVCAEGALMRCLFKNNPYHNMLLKLVKYNSHIFFFLSPYSANVNRIKFTPKIIIIIGMLWDFLKNHHSQRFSFSILL